MKKKECYKQFLTIFTISILFISFLPIVLGYEINIIENDDNEPNNPEKSLIYNNCIVLINGKCKSVRGPLLWLLGFYYPLLKRSFVIQAMNREDESLSVIILGTSPLQFATYYDYENIYIRITKAKGMFYWGEKSIVTKSDSLLVFCRASSVFVTT